MNLRGKYSLFVVPVLVALVLTTWLTSVQADQIKLKDGRTLEGKIVSQTSEHVTIKMKWGNVKVARYKIVKVITKTTPQEEYKQRFAKLQYDDAQGFYELGVFAKKNNMSDKARRCFKKTIAINRNHKQAREELGYVLYRGRWIKKSKLEKIEKKENTPKEGTSSSGGSPKSNLVSPEGTPKEALDLIKEADKYYQEARRNPAKVRENLKKAISCLRRASYKKYNNPIPYYKMGIFYQHTRDYKRAKFALLKAIRHNPKFHEAVVELGDTYTWMVDYDRAIEEYNRAIEMEPKYSQSYKSKALLLCRLREFKKARDALKKAVEVNPHDWYSRRILGMVKKEIKGPTWKNTIKVESKNYVVYTNDTKEYAETISEHAELIYKVYTKIFPKLKKRKDQFPIYVYKTKAGYVKDGSPSGSAGYFHPILQKLVFYKQKDLNNTLTVLYHEGFHQYVYYYSPYIPQWFNEGNGDFFGGCRKKGRVLEIKPNKWRLGTIKRAIRKKKYVPLAKLMKMSKRQMYSGNKGLHYAQAWAMVYYLWMYEGGKYRAVIKRYFTLIREGYGRVEAFDKTFGRLNMEDMEREWKSFVLKLK